MSKSEDIQVIHSDREGMAAALAEARKALAIHEVPIGAVICDGGGKIIGRGYNLRENQHDATAHAEIVAIREACASVRNWRLSDMTLYVTIEPCPMCAGALFMSRIKRLVYGAPDWRAGACESVFNVVENPWLTYQMEVRAGVMEDECSAIVKQHFQRLRSRLK